MPGERVEEAVDAGAAIGTDKEPSREARPAFCRSADARSADDSAASCGAVDEVEEAALADEAEGRETEDDDDDDDMSSGTRDGATVRRMVSSVCTRI